MKKDEFIEDWLINETDVSEREALEKLIAFTEKMDVPSHQSSEESWDALLGKIEAQTHENQRILIPKESKKSHWLLWVSGYAATFALICFLLVKQYQKVEWNILVAHVGETEMLDMPDASSITLNSSSELRYPLENWSQARTIQLYGEAFFEVTKGEPFVVETSNGTVKVLGTSFNVYSRENHFSVTCKTGMVVVDSNDQQLTLTAGQMATLDKGDLTLLDYPLDKIAAWRFGEFYFDASPLKSVINELERQFDIRIIVNTDISERFYSGFFSKTNLNEALQLVFVPMGLKFEINEGEVTIN